MYLIFLALMVRRWKQSQEEIREMSDWKEMSEEGDKIVCERRTSV